MILLQIQPYIFECRNEKQDWTEEQDHKSNGEPRLTVKAWCHHDRRLLANGEVLNNQNPAFPRRESQKPRKISVGMSEEEVPSCTSDYEDKN